MCDNDTAHEYLFIFDYAWKYKITTVILYEYLIKWYAIHSVIFLFYQIKSHCLSLSYELYTYTYIIDKIKIESIYRILLTKTYKYILIILNPKCDVHCYDFNPLQNEHVKNVKFVNRNYYY